MVLRDSGLPTAHRLAAEQLEVALLEMPKDAICRHALGDCYVKSGNLKRAVGVLEQLLENPSRKTKEKTYPLLLECYDGLGEMLNAADMRNRISH
jgi:tetratricopeptide (TPR) repeat protein